MSLITLTTDFGTRDHYVAVMKGGILRIAPHATIVDVTHQIDPYGIMHAAFVLRRTVEWFPPDTIHVVVVDPGVGSSRDIIACRCAQQIIICPDNGLISLLHRDLSLETVHLVENANYFSPGVSHTFHGRDIMAPVAAHLARGAPLPSVGPKTDRIDVFKLDEPKPLHPAGWAGSVISIDAFGNLVTNITRANLDAVGRTRESLAVWLDDVDVGSIRATYSDVPAGQLLALVGSSEMLEIAVNRGSAADKLCATVGATVHVR